MALPDHLTCLLRNLYAGQEATVRTGHGTTDWFQIGKGVHQGCILSPCLLNLYAEYIMRNAGLEEAQAGIKISRRNINNLIYADGTTLMAENEEELKCLLIIVKEENKKIGLRLIIQKMKIIASGPTTSLEIDGETVGTVSDFILGGSKITGNGNPLQYSCLENPRDRVPASPSASHPTSGSPLTHVLLLFTCILIIIGYACDSRESILTYVYHHFSQHITVLILLS